MKPRSHPAGALADVQAPPPWYVLSLGVNAVASAVDYSVLLVLTHLATLRPALAVSVAATVGTALSFVGNRRLAFAERGADGLGREALRYLAAMAVLLALHGMSAACLRAAGVPLIPSKMAADFFVLGLNQPWVLKRFVFQRFSGAERRPPKSSGVG